MNLEVLAATLVDVVDFFPVTLLFGVSKFLFSALALSFVLAMLASYVVAMTVIPLFCARFLKAVPHSVPDNGEHGIAEKEDRSWGGRFNRAFNRGFNRVLDVYERVVRRALKRPGLTVAAIACLFVASLGIYPFVGRAFFPQTDAGQFTINMKVPTGTRIEVTNDYVARIEGMIRRVVEPKDLKMVLSNIGVVNDISALYTTNQGQYTATIQVALNDEHKVGSLEYMDRVRDRLAREFPDVRAFFQSGSMVDAILNSGMPAPIDVQVNTRDLDLTYNTAQDLAARIRRLPGVGQIYIPQDMNYPTVRMDIDRVHAGELGLSQKDVIENVITALNSNIMIAPNYWVDYETKNDYFLSVQYAEHGKGAIHNLVDLKEIPLRSPNLKQPTTLDSVVKLVNLQSPTEIDHYQIQPVADVYAHSRRGGSEQIDRRDPPEHHGRQTAFQHSREPPRHGQRHGPIVQELRYRLRPFLRPPVSDLGGAIPILGGSAADHVGDSDGICGGLDYPAAYAYDAQRNVSGGSADADRHRRLQQHSDCRFRPQAGRAGAVAGRRRDYRLPRAPAA